MIIVLWKVGALWIIEETGQSSGATFAPDYLNSAVQTPEKKIIYKVFPVLTTVLCTSRGLQGRQQWNEMTQRIPGIETFKKVYCEWDMWQGEWWLYYYGDWKTSTLQRGFGADCSHCYEPRLCFGKSQEVKMILLELGEFSFETTNHQWPDCLKYYSFHTLLHSSPYTSCQSPELV